MAEEVDRQLTRAGVRRGQEAIENVFLIMSIPSHGVAIISHAEKKKSSVFRVLQSLRSVTRETVLCPASSSRGDDTVVSVNSLSAGCFSSSFLTSADKSSSPPIAYLLKTATTLCVATRGEQIHV